MKYQIKHRYNDSVLFEIEADSFVKTVEEAIKQSTNLSYANLRYANLRYADLRYADLRYADLRYANLGSADLSSADLRYANLGSANLSYANLRYANLRYADLRYADLRSADLSYANLGSADLSYANLGSADLSSANLGSADLTGAKNLVKIMGVEPSNFYWKRFEKGLKNNDYQFYVGLNTLREGEVFASDDRVVCSHPGFHFASRSWCAVYYPDRPLEARIRIPEDAQINEPWTTDGKASADKIEIIQVFDVKTGKDVTDKYRKPE